MSEYSRQQIASRLEALGGSLAEFPEGEPCPWPIARIFNELLKQARREVEDDPVLMSIRYLEEASDRGGGASNTLATTVRALINQVTLSVGAAKSGEARKDAGAAARPAPPSGRRR